MSDPVLIVEDEPLQRQMLATLLRRKLDYGAQAVENGRQALDLLEADERKSVKLVIMDLNMPVMGGLETLDILRQKYPHIPVIMLTGSKDIHDAVEAMKRGAIDFLNKPYEADRMVVTVKNALKISILSQEVTRLKSRESGHFGFDNLIGHEGGLMPTLNIARKAASSDIPVLITGETGTGKEVFAQAIHGESARAGKPFIAINCGAIPSQLVESTLFGHEKGSFTGATEKAAGKFREAEGGTIFLDEVGELPLDTQVKLLRVLQQKEVEPVGGTKAIPVNVRIISATNRDLQKEVEEGLFREDLFFRLNVLELSLPPLRDRKGDLILLADHFIERYCSNENCLPKALSEQAREKLIAYDWPGNVRQLENAVRRAIVMSDSVELSADDFILQGGGSYEAPVQFISDDSQTSDFRINLMDTEGAFKTVERIEREMMKIALDYFDGNVTQTAKALGMAKSTFYKKMV